MHWQGCQLTTEGTMKVLQALENTTKFSQAIKATQPAKAAFRTTPNMTPMCSNLGP